MLWGSRTRGSQSHFLLEMISKHMVKKNLMRSGQYGLPTGTLSLAGLTAHTARWLAGWQRVLFPSTARF